MKRRIDTGGMTARARGDGWALRSPAGRLVATTFSLWRDDAWAFGACHGVVRDPRQARRAGWRCVRVRLVEAPR